MVVDIDNRPKKENCKVPVKEFGRKEPKFTLSKALEKSRRQQKTSELFPR